MRQLEKEKINYRSKSNAKTQQPHQDYVRPGVTEAGN